MFRRLGFQAIAGLSALLPRSCQYACARRVADCYHLLDSKARENVRANLRVILGDDAPEALVRQEARWVFRSFGAYICEFLGYSPSSRKWGPRFLEENVIVQGRENLDAALAAGRGAIFCSAHYSNWELGATMVAHLGYPIVIIAQMHGDPRVNDLFVKQRAEAGIEIVPTQHGAIGALRALRGNRPVAMLADRATGGPVVEVEFFGRQTFLPLGPWRIAEVSGAPLLPTFVTRRHNHGFTLEIGPPIAVPQSAVGSRQSAGGSRRASGTPAVRTEKMAALAQAWADGFEARLRKDPSQWAVFYRVWDDPRTGALGLTQSLSHALYRDGRITMKQPAADSQETRAE